MTEPITDQQLADAIRERFGQDIIYARAGDHHQAGERFLGSGMDSALAELLLANPAPITPEVGKTYQHKETGNLGAYVGPNPDWSDGHYFKMKTGVDEGIVTDWFAYNITEAAE